MMMVVMMVRVRVIRRLHDMVLHLLYPLVIQMMVVHHVRVMMMTAHNQVEWQLVSMMMVLKPRHKEVHLVVLRVMRCLLQALMMLMVTELLSLLLACGHCRCRYCR